MRYAFPPYELALRPLDPNLSGNHRGSTR
jgi:hypothetical protein